MIEYDLFTRMLSRDFLSPDQQVMEEPKQAGAHTCAIVDKGVDFYKAYRYDLEEFDFLPFFNKEHDDEERGVVADNPTLTGLLKFCDYILLATVNDKLYVVLVEMKSGNNTGANQQLDASKTFIDYIKASAERIKTLCGYEDFNSRNIILRKVLLKPAPKTRPITNIGKGKSQIDWGANPIVLKQQVFPLLQVCECRQR
jgi:hypothetical protein